MKNELAAIETQEKMLELEVKRFELEQRRATALSKSAFFPNDLKGDVASAVIIYDLAQRMNVSVMEVAQSVYIIHGRPSFSTAFIVARLNQSGLIHGALRTIVSEDKQSAYCEAVDAISGEKLVGMSVTMEMAQKEGWLSKRGSKWQTMPELMMRKRSQSFFIKEFYPQVLFGLQTEEEIKDFVEDDKKEYITTALTPKEKPKPKRVARKKAEVEATQEAEKAEVIEADYDEAIRAFGNEEEVSK